MSELSEEGEREALLNQQVAGGAGGAQLAGGRKKSSASYLGDSASSSDKASCGTGSWRPSLELEQPPKNQLWGTLLVVAAVITFSLSNLLVKKSGVPLPIILQIRFSVCLVLATCCMLYFVRHQRLQLFGPPEVRRWVVLKSLLTFSFTLFWYAAISTAPLGECTAVVYCGPMVTAPLGYLVLKEQFPRLFPLQVVLLAMGAVMVEDEPLVHRLLHDGQSSPPEAEQGRGYGQVMLALALLFGGAAPLVTRLTHACSWMEVEHANACLSALLFNPLFVLGWSMHNESLPGLPQSAPGKELLPVLGAGVLSFAGLALETQGYQMAEPGKASTFRCLEIPFSYLLQRLFTKTKVSGWDLAGAALIVVSAVVGGLSQAAQAEQDDRVREERAAAQPEDGNL